ncbi:MAG: hypothetical protein IT317_03065, partial [Anaerolineales bacterium]|nr:hypothetical protein [Anaerolineales bacterium]
PASPLTVAAQTSPPGAIATAIVPNPPPTQPPATPSPAPAATATTRPESGLGATATPLPTLADLHSPFAGHLPLEPQFPRVYDLSFVDPLNGWAVVAVADPLYPVGWALVYRTSDGGQHWQALSSPEALIYSSELAPYLPALNRIRFFNALEGELTGTHRFVTADGGLTWENTGPYDPRLAPVTLEAGQFRLEPHDCAPAEPPDYPNYTHCPYRLQRLSDGAWQAAGLSFTAITAELVAADARTAWIVAYAQAEADTTPVGRLWRTHDGGRTWEPLPDLPSTWPLMDDVWQWFFAPADGRHVWLVSGDAGAGIFGGKVLYVSDDGGRTGSLRAQTEIAGADRFGDIPVPGYLLGFTAVTGEQAYMVRGRMSFLVTRDGGRTWQEAIPEYIFPGDDNATGPIVFLDDQHGWAVTGDAVYSTVDSGHTWRPGILPGLPSVTPQPPSPTPWPTGYPGGPTPAPTATPGLSAWPNRVAGAGLIISDSAGLPGWPIAVTNFWVQLRTGVRVYAGVTSAAGQGAVAVLTESTDPDQPELYLTPSRAGAVQVVDARGERLVLQTLDGQATFYFDVPTRRFVDSLAVTSPAPTVTLVPTFSATLGTPAAVWTPGAYP